MNDLERTIKDALDNLILGNTEFRVDADLFEGSARELAVLINTLAQQLDDLKNYTLKIGEGDFDAEAPDRHNYLAGTLKNMHYKLRHVIWQAQQVSMGDYDQQLDYMGEFSESFNRMLMEIKKQRAQLLSQHEQIITQHNMILKAFDKIDSMIIISDPSTSQVLFLNRQAKTELKTSTNNGKSKLLDAVVISKDKSNWEVYDEGTQQWYSIVSTPITWTGGVSATLNSCRNITPDKRHEEYLVNIASTDELTGVLNRRAGMAQLQGELNTLGENQVLCICFVDIDDLKYINDKFGHMMGDECITIVTKALIKGVRKSDMVIRYGGDEFIVVFSRTKEEIAIRVMDRILEKLENCNQAGKYPFQVSFSYGVNSVKGGSEIDLNVLLETADKTMYKAKKAKKRQLKLIN